MNGKVGTALLATAGLLVTLGAGAAEAAGVCSLQGTNYYTPRLTGTAGNFAVRSQGTLAACASEGGAGAVNGTRSLGNIWTGPNGWQWQEPVGAGTGNCTSTTLNGTYIVRWADGGVTVVQQTTTSNTWAIRATGTVLPAVTLTAHARKTGQPATLVLSTTRHAGNAVTAAKLSHPNPADPLECTATGLPASARSGTLTFHPAP
jgi:hypothetical protein